jgi:glycosyltransferase domain-containing protein
MIARDIGAFCRRRIEPAIKRWLDPSSSPGLLELPKRLSGRRNEAIADFTLIVPTFNRPADLRRLLRYLSRQPQRFRILIAESSAQEVRRHNVASAEELGLQIEILEFPTEMPQFEKFWRVASEVRTAYCSICADDDVLLTDAIQPTIDFLRAHSDYVMAHGWYLYFKPGKDVVLSSIAYASPSLAAGTVLGRLRQLFRPYEALIYGLHRTACLRTALTRVRPLESTLGMELLSAALTAAQGKIARVPQFYYGRALSPSNPFHHWHPVQILIDSPEQLFRYYGSYRKILLEFLEATEDPQVMGPHVDLIHLAYISEFLNPDLLHFLSGQRERGTSNAETLRHSWPFILPKPAKPPESKEAFASLLEQARLGVPRAFRVSERHRSSNVIAKDSGHRIRVSDQFLADLRSLAPNAMQAHLTKAALHLCSYSLDRESDIDPVAAPEHVTDHGPSATTDGHDLPRLPEEHVPGVAEMVDDLSQELKDPVR